MIWRFRILAPINHLFIARCSCRCDFQFFFLVAGLLPSWALAIPQTETAQPSTTVASADVTQRINQRLQETWQRSQVVPSKSAGDGEWCRRLFLDVIGRIPSGEEVTAFASDRDRSKRQKLVDELLYAERYAREYVDRWATIWSNLLVGRTGGQNDEDFINREGLWDYLEGAFLANRRYDQFALELITATGNNRPGERDF